MKKIILIALLGIVSFAKAQVDPHFSQYYMHPLWLNPALTGATNGDYRVGVIDRSQWSSVTKAFSTVGLSADFTTSKNLNFGLSLLQQTAGDAGYKYFNGMGSISYSGIRFGREGTKVITFGMSAGIISQGFDFSKLKGGYQYKPYFGFEPIGNGENFANGKKSTSMFDMGAGVTFFDADPDKKTNFFGGFSAAHITQPKNSFFVSSATPPTLDIRYTLHGGARVLLSENSSIVPNALIMKEGKSQEIMLGGYWQISVIEEVDLMAGVNYRVKDAFYPYLGLNFNNLIVGLSYDVNASQMSTTGAKGASSYEFSLMYSNRKGTDKGFFKCPRF